MSKNNIIRRLACFVLCFYLVSISSNVVFAGSNSSLIFGTPFISIKANILKDLLKITPKDLLKDAPKDKPKDTPKDKPKVTPIVPPKVTPKVPPKVTPKITPTATPIITPTVTPIVTPTATPIVTPTVTPTVTPIEINAMQSFILDSMDSKNNEDIAIELSNCTPENISQTAKSISSLLNGTWKSNEGEEKLKDILNIYLNYTPKAKLCLWAVIDEGYDGVVIPITLSNKLKAKINYDFTGNQDDDRGTKFMVKSLLIFDEVAELFGEELLTVEYGQYNQPKIILNRLNNYKFITDSVNEVFGSLETLPFASDNFEGFIDYYEEYINNCGAFGIVSFLRLLDANGISYTVKN